MLIAHLSDPHLTTGVLAAEPALGLHRALGRVLALDPQPDCVVVTGDLVDHGRVDEYSALREVIGAFPLPLHLVTGNHDNREALIAVFGDTRYLGDGATFRYVVEYPEGTVVALDSLVPGSDEGRLGAEQLDWLEDVLSRRPDAASFVCLHHPPIPVGIPVLDGIRLSDGEELRKVIARHPQVVRVLAGHVHRPITAQFAGTLLAVAPSTYRQSALCLGAQQKFTYVPEPTGFLLHQSCETGYVTHTVQVSHAAGSHGSF